MWLPKVTSKTGKEVRQSFDAAGLGCQNCHFSWSDFHDNYAETIETAHALGLKSAVCQSLASQSKTADGWKWHADHLNELGRKTKRDGILTGYHNHPTEFKEIDGAIPFDLLLSGTDPELVKFQLDIGSVVVAGKDPIAYLTGHPDRYFSIHVKDVRDGKIGLAVGEGSSRLEKDTDRGQTPAAAKLRRRDRCTPRCGDGQTQAEPDLFARSLALMHLVPENKRALIGRRNDIDRAIVIQIDRRQMRTNARAVVN